MMQRPTGGRPRERGHKSCRRLLTVWNPGSSPGELIVFIGLWCKGSAWGFGPQSRGSIPRGPTKLPYRISVVRLTLDQKGLVRFQLRQQKIRGVLVRIKTPKDTRPTIRTYHYLFGGYRTGTPKRMCRRLILERGWQQVFKLNPF